MLLNEVQNSFKLTDDYKFLSSSDAIFHYTKAKIAIELILENATLRFSKIVDADDPYEYKFSKGNSIFGFNVELEQQREMLKYFKKLIDNNCFRISFCKNSFSDDSLKCMGFLKSRMWSQYGEGHQGVCLVFSKSKIIEEVEAIKNERDIFLHGDIKYTETITLNLNSSDGYSDKNDMVQKLMNSIKDQKKKFFSKVIDYEDENEFRLFLAKENIERGEMIDVDIRSSIKYIIVGDKFPKKYYSSIKSFGEKFNIPCKKLSWENGFYITSINLE